MDENPNWDLLINNVKGLIILAWGLSGAYCIIMCVCKLVRIGHVRFSSES